MTTTVPSRPAFPCWPTWRWHIAGAGGWAFRNHGVPAFGAVAPGVYSAVCPDGRGTAKGTLAGMAAAALATATDSWRVRGMPVYEDRRSDRPEPGLSGTATLSIPRQAAMYLPQTDMNSAHGFAVGERSRIS